jgi:RsiW-degrading membrane proteinase PrsW (M82 family)
MKHTSTSVVTTALWKGCLGGIALAAGFLVISGGTYLLTTFLNLPPQITIFISILSGPVIGTALLAGYLLWRPKRALDIEQHETPAGN